MARIEIQVRFFDDRYHGYGGWPPDPARIFQALVFGGHIGAASRSWTESHEKALEWLCALPAPEIDCRPIGPCCAYSIFVPNNSLDPNRQSTKTTKRVKASLLTATNGDSPDLIYRWTAPDPAEAHIHLPALDQLASRLLALGWGIDLATAEAVAAIEESRPRAGYETLVPSHRGGRPMRTLAPGLLAHLRDCYEASRVRVTARGVNPYTRPTDFRMMPYRKLGENAPRVWCAFELQRIDGESFSLDWRRVQDVAAWLRHMAGEAMMEEFGDEDKPWIDSYVMGHTAKHELGRRLSYLPLPSVGHLHSDGGIRRVLIVTPAGAVGRDVEAVELLRIKAPGHPLMPPGNKRPEAALVPVPSGGGSVFRRYCTSACSWRSVTPVILHGHNTDRKGLSVRKTEKLIFQAIDSAGYSVDAVERLSFQTAPYWPGCGPASAIKTPQHLNRWPRLHVAIDFKRSIEGPLAIGLGRHYGIGIFAAIDD